MNLTTRPWHLSHNCLDELRRQERALRERAVDLRREHAYLTSLADELHLRIVAESVPHQHDAEHDDLRGHNHD